MKFNNLTRLTLFICTLFICQDICAQGAVGGLNAGTGVVANAGPDQVLTCTVSEVTLGSDSTSVGPDIVYEWTVNTGSFFSGMDTQFPTVVESGDYYLKVTDTNLGQMAFDTVAVTFDFEIPAVTVAQPDILTCLNPSVTLMPSVGGIGDFSYQWTGPNGEIYMQENPVVNIAGEYALLVTNLANGCEELVSVQVVQDTPTPDVVIGTPPFLNPGESIQLVGSSTFPNVTYEWSLDGVFFSATPSPIVNTAGTYCLTVTSGDNGCSANSCVEVISTSAVIADAGPDQVITCTNETVILDGSNSSIGTDLEYEWVNQIGISISSAIMHPVQMPGIYTLIVTNTVSGVSASDVVEVFSDQILPNISFESSYFFSCELIPLDINADVTNGQNFTFEWSTVNGNIISSTLQEDIVVDASGDYTLVVTNVETGCSSSEIVTVEYLVTPINATIAPPPSINPGQTIQLNGVGSTVDVSVEYEWNTPNGNIVNGEFTLTPTISSAGTYCLTVFDIAQGCEATTCVDVLINNLVVADAGEEMILTCNVASVSIGGPNTSMGPEYEYVWTNEFGQVIDTSPFTNVAESGTYILTVTNSTTGDSNSSSVLVSENFEIPEIQIVSDDILDCNTPTVLLSGVVTTPGPLSFEWTGNSGMPISTQSTAMVSEAGIYTLTVTSLSSGCSTEQATNVVRETDSPEVSIAPPPLLVSGQSIELVGMASGFGAPFSFVWSNSIGEQIGFSSSIIVSEFGTYCLMAIGDNGCESSACIEVLPSGTVVADAGADQFLTCTNQTVSLGGSNSSTGANITYAWVDQNGTLISNNPNVVVQMPGVYSLTVSNTLTNVADTDMVVVTNDVAQPNITIAPPLEMDCERITVELDATVSNGFQFSYSWTTPNGNITSNPFFEDITIDTEGLYSLQVVNTNNGCINTASIVAVADRAMPEAIIAPAPNITPGQTIQLDGSGSSVGSSIVYNWYTPNGNIVSGQNTLMPTISIAGQYCLEVSNTDNACDEAVCIFVNNNNAIVADAGFSQTLTCSIAFASLGGPNTTMGSEYEYIWTDEFGQVIATSPFTDVDQPGTYTLTVTNTQTGDNSSSAVVVSVDQELPIFTFSSSSYTLDCITTSVVLEPIVNGSDLYTYMWSGPSGAISDERDLLVNTPGDYTLTVTDLGNGCSSQNSILVLENVEAPSVAINPPSLLTPGQTVELIGTAIGTEAPFVFEWTAADGSILGNTPTLVVSEVGTYCLKATGQNGCDNTTCVEVLLNEDMPFAIVADPPMLVPGQSIQLDGSSSSQGAGYNYLWTTTNGNILSGENTLMPIVNRGGDYCLDVTNMSNGLESTACVKVIKENILFADAGEDQIISCSNDNVTIGGHCSSEGSEYAYIWTDMNGAVFSDTPFTDVDLIGSYILTVTNIQSGEFLMDTVQVLIDENIFSIDVQVQNISCFGLADGTIEILPSGGAPPYEITTPIPMTNLAAGTYTIAATDANGCMEEVSIEIIEPQQLSIEIEITDMNEIIANVSGGVMPYTYDWSDGSDSTTVTEPIDGTTYTLNITDANGCTLSDELFYVFDAVGQVRAQELDCYPNPAQDYVVLELEDIASGLSHFEILDLQGRNMILVQSFSGPDKMKVQVNDFSPGTYFIHAIVNDQLFYQKLIIIE